MNSVNFKTRWLGEIKYDTALELQNSYIEKAKTEGKNFFLGLEHPLTYTLGLRSHNTTLKTKAPVFKIRRGGEIVIHNPGQLVIYPIFNLKKDNYSIKDFVCALEKTSIKTLKNLAIKVNKKTEPGLYSDVGKIVFLGLGVSKGITSHGLAINVCNNLKDFENTEICGVKNQSMDRVLNYDSSVDTKTLFELWVKEFETVDICSNVM